MRLNSDPPYGGKSKERISMSLAEMLAILSAADGLLKVIEAGGNALRRNKKLTDEEKQALLRRKKALERRAAMALRALEDGV